MAKNVNKRWPANLDEQVQIKTAVEALADEITAGGLAVDLDLEDITGASPNNKTLNDIFDQTKYSGESLAEMIGNSSASNTPFFYSGSSVAYWLYNIESAVNGGTGQSIQGHLDTSNDWEPYYYSGYSLAYSLYTLASCVSNGRVLTSPDNY